MSPAQTAPAGTTAGTAYHARASGWAR